LTYRGQRHDGAEFLLGDDEDDDDDDDDDDEAAVKTVMFISAFLF
jgi:hypothetical protein